MSIPPCLSILLVLVFCLLNWLGLSFQMIIPAANNKSFVCLLPRFMFHCFCLPYCVAGNFNMVLNSSGVNKHVFFPTSVEILLFFFLSMIFTVGFLFKMIGYDRFLINGYQTLALKKNRSPF